MAKTTYSNYSGYNANPYDDIRDGMTATKTTSGKNSYGVQQVSYNPYAGELGGAAAKPAAVAAVPAATGSQPSSTAADPYASHLASLKAQQAAETLARRTSAWEDLNAVFSAYGIDTDGSGLSAQIREWVFADKSASWITLNLRTTSAYQKRFPGMAALIKKGQAMDEATYIAQERAYRSVLQQYGLPSGFYDGPEDFGKFIANGVSVNEVNDRVKSAKTFLDSANSAYKDALASMGVDQGSMLAYVLDGDKAQSIITQQFKQAALSGAAKSKGDFNLTGDEAGKYAQTLGDDYNAIGADQVNALERSFADFGVQADQDERLSTIDNEAFKRTDTLDANLLSDTDKQLASQRRAQRERGRFAGSSAVKSGSLSRSTGA